MFQTIWKALENKKMTIGGIIAAFVVYALGRHWLQQDTAQLITLILGALGLGGNIYDSQVAAKKETEADLQ